MPEELSIEGLNKIIDRVFDNLKPTGIKDFGMVMKEISPMVQGKVDMSLVTKIIKEKLSI